jgi:diguanylate cyclase (GGDEF)-like protein
MRLSQTSRRLVLVGAILVAAIGATAGLLVWTQRAADLAESRQETDNLARVLAEQTSNSMQAVDLALREIVGWLTNTKPGNPDALAASAGTKALYDLLTEKLKSLPQADALLVTGADGRLLINSRGFPTAVLDLSDRDYFRHFTTLDDHGVFVSAPMKSYMSGLWTVYLARRLNDAHGNFAGIAAVALTLSFLEDFYRAVTPENQAVTVLRRDGTILVRYPAVEDKIGRKLPSEAPWYDILEKGGGFYRSPGYVASVVSLVSVRPLRDFPMVIDASTTEAAALSRWHRQTLWLLAGAFVAAACVGSLLRVFGLQMGRLERSAVSLAQQNTLLETSRLQFNAVLQNMSQGLTLYNKDRELVICNHRFAEMYGLSAEETRPGTSFSQIIDYRVTLGTAAVMTPAAYLARAENLVGAKAFFELTNELHDGRTVFLHSQPLASGGWVSTHEDITERRRTEAKLAFMAQHDALTELPNRSLFEERLALGVGMTDERSHCALLCLDLDRFKVINDTLGHPIGDELLRAVAGRLLGAVRECDTVARLGGDEFAIVQVGVESAEHAAALAERIIKTIGQPFEIDGHRAIVGVSIGISLSPRDGTATEALRRSADIALYLSKTRGRGTYRFFEFAMDAHIHELRLVELDLREALTAENFELHYQPILDLQSGSVSGFEALIRWNHPVRGLISPADFIPIAEETGLIVQIGEWALREACVAAAGWPQHIEIAVNLSPVQFTGCRLLDVVEAALRASGLAPDRLILEITESVLLDDSDDRLVLLHQFRALGIRIALDDFGTGYSSLSYLRSFPFDKIKIDRSFIRDLDTSQDSRVIVGAMLGLARNLFMTSVAEGVETRAQLAILRDQGCNKVQGFLFSRPVPEANVLGLIQTLCVDEGHRYEPAAAEPETKMVSLR